MSSIKIEKKRLRRSVEFTRPSNTTAYSAGDVVSDNATATTKMTFSDITKEGGCGVIVGAMIITDKKSITPQLRLHLFTSSTPTVSADNAAHQELYVDVASKVGTIDFAAMSTPADTSNSTLSRTQNFSVNVPFRLASGSKKLFGVIEAIDAFTPASGQKFTVILLCEVDS